MIQLKITEKRKKTWESWKEQSRFEVKSQVVWEAIETALRFKEVQKNAKIKAEINPELIR